MFPFQIGGGYGEVSDGQSWVFHMLDDVAVDYSLKSCGGLTTIDTDE